MPPPVPPAPPQTAHTPANVVPSPPEVPLEGPPGAFLVELCVLNGHPFADHWAYFIRPARSPSIGSTIQASGDVLRGFAFQIERNHDIEHADNKPTKRIPLQWVDGAFPIGQDRLSFDTGKLVVDPTNPLEMIMQLVEVPGKSLKSVRSVVTPGKRIVQRNCQTWVVEAAEELVKWGMFEASTAAYLRAIKQ
jgi:hypothetical protein